MNDSDYFHISDTLHYQHVYFLYIRQFRLLINTSISSRACAFLGTTYRNVSRLAKRSVDQRVLAGPTRRNDPSRTSIDKFAWIYKSAIDQKIVTTGWMAIHVHSMCPSLDEQDSDSKLPFSSGQQPSPPQKITRTSPVRNRAKQYPFSPVSNFYFMTGHGQDNPWGEFLHLWHTMTTVYIDTHAE